MSGSAGLPLVLVDGVTAMTGRYPDRTQLASWAGLDAAPAGGNGVGLAAATVIEGRRRGGGAASSYC